MIENGNNEKITINGLVIPCQWDNEGNVKGITLAGFDETNYAILMDKVGKSLLTLLHKKVVISGKFTKINNSDKIRVQKYHLIENL